MQNYLNVFNSGDSFRAVCIGDSTTSQDWCHPNWIAWLNYTFRETDTWQKDWRRRVINCGRDGGTFDHFLQYFNDEVALYKPHLVILSLGINNLIPEFDPLMVKGQLEQLLGKIKDIGADIITWSPYAFPKDRYSSALDEINLVYTGVVKNAGGLHIDMYHEFLNYKLDEVFSFKSPDGNESWGIKPGHQDFLHCNEIGNQIIAQAILRDGFNMKLNEWEFGTMRKIDLKSYKRK